MSTVLFTTGATDALFSSANRIEFTVNTDAGGGTLLVNRAFILANFTSPPPVGLLAFFGQTFATQAAAEAAMRALEITIIPRTAGAAVPSTIVTLAPVANVPSMFVGGSISSGLWRIRIRLPHSIVG